MGLRERKSVNYAEEKVGTNTPAWMKGSKGVVGLNRPLESDDEGSPAAKPSSQPLSAKFAKASKENKPVASEGAKGKKAVEEKHVPREVLSSKEAAANNSKKAAHHAEKDSAKGRKSAGDASSQQYQPEEDAPEQKKKQRSSKSAPLPPPDAAELQQASQKSAASKRKSSGSVPEPMAADLKQSEAAPASKKQKQGKEAPAVPPAPLPEPAPAAAAPKRGGKSTGQTGADVAATEPKGKSAGSSKGAAAAAVAAPEPAAAPAAANNSSGSRRIKTLEEIAAEQQKSKQAKPRPSLGTQSLGAGKDALNADEAGNSRGAAQAVASQPAAAPPQPALAAPPEAAATAGGSKQGKGTKHRPSMSGTQSAGQPQPQQPVALQGVASSGAPARELPEADIAALLAPVAPGSVLDVRAFTMLQEQYMRLQKLYQEVKAQKITELEGILEEQDEYMETLNENVNKLAQHWKEEAERQLALCKTAGAAETLERMVALEEENMALKKARIDQEVAILQLQMTQAQLEQQLAEAQEVAEQAVQAATQARAELAAAQEAAAAMAAAAPVEPVGAITPGVPASAGAVTPAPTVIMGVHRTIAMQCPTPPVPSPGIGCQFPSPAPAVLAEMAGSEQVQGTGPSSTGGTSAEAGMGTGPEAGSGPEARDQLPAQEHAMEQQVQGQEEECASVMAVLPTPSGHVLRGTPTELAACNGPRATPSPSPMVGRQLQSQMMAAALGMGANAEMCLGSESVSMQARQQARSSGSNGDVGGSAGGSGSPVEGLCVGPPGAGGAGDGTVQGRAPAAAAAVTAEPRALAPEGADRAGAGLAIAGSTNKAGLVFAAAGGARPASVVFQQEEVVVDLNPQSARKAQAAMARTAAVTAAGAANPSLPNTASTPSLVLDGAAGPAAAAAVAAATGVPVSSPALGVPVAGVADMQSVRHAQLVHQQQQLAQFRAGHVNSVVQSTHPPLALAAQLDAAAASALLQQQQQAAAGAGAAAHAMGPAAADGAAGSGIGMSQGLQQLVAAANTAAAALHQQTESLSLSINSHMPPRPPSLAGAGAANVLGPVPSPPMPAAGLMHHSPKLSQQGSNSGVHLAGAPAMGLHGSLGAVAGAVPPGSAARTPGRLVVRGVTQQTSLLQGLKTPSMTPKMLRMQVGVLNLFGFEVRPLAQEGAYEYRHAATGLRFQTRPVPLSSELSDSELAELLAPGSQLYEYTPMDIGTAPLPAHLRETIQFEEGQKQAFMNQLWAAISKPRQVAPAAAAAAPPADAALPADA